MELQNENTQIKEELAFLQKLFSDSGKQGDDHDPAPDRRTPSATMLYHYSLSGGARRQSDRRIRRPTDDAGDAAGRGGAPVDDVTCPKTRPELGAALKLKFKYYQRVEGTIRVPPGSQLKALHGQGPRARAVGTEGYVAA